MKEMMLKAEGNCPYCGRQLINEVKESEKYDWMIRSCVHCGEKYADERYFEPALFHYTPQKMSEETRGKGVVLLAFGGVFLVGTIVAGWGILGEPFTLRKLLWISTGLMLFGIWYLIIPFFKKEKEKYEILYGESLLRLQNETYIQDLLNAGYEVPQDVLDDLKFVKQS